MAACMAYWDPQFRHASLERWMYARRQWQACGRGLRGSWSRDTPLIEAIKTWEGR
jgi:hypothetical protein